MLINLYRNGISMKQIKSMNKISHIVESKECCGCSACKNICPAGAISMQENEEGFLYPNIDETKCSHCGLCSKICPVINSDFSNNKNPDCFAVMADDDLRKESSSGAVFPVLAEYIISEGGYVCGAAYADDFSVEHLIVDTGDDLGKLKGSKYVQSNIKDCYSKIKEVLNTGKKVLFSGCPCQVAGLKSFLQKDYENLLCVDLICHGVPSAKVFKKYLSETFPDEKVEKFDFRDKTYGWKEYYLGVKTNIKKHLLYPASNLFMRGFLNNLFLRESCYVCQFQKLPRQGDLTIGDFWGIYDFDRNLDDDKGTSLLLVNNDKGKRYFEKLKNNFIMRSHVPLKHAIKYNSNIVKPSKKHTQRQRFFYNIDKYTLENNMENCLNDRADVGIMNLFYSKNYGAVLTAYAMQEVIEQLGFSAKIVNYTPSKKESSYFNTRFRNKYLNLTKRLITDKDLFGLNFNIHCFITGSDQVFRSSILSDYNKYLLDFVSPENKKIAFSASFGIGTPEIQKEMSAQDMQAYTNSLKSFDFVSTREDSGVEICKKYFNTEAHWVIDPVFLLDSIKYDELINNCKNIDDKYKNSIVTYILDNNEKVEKLLNQMSKKLDKKIQQLSAENDTDVEEWLYAFKNASYIITDSFHGCCFALIFNKPFLCIKNKQRGNARFDSLANKFKLKNVFVSDIESLIESNDLFPDMDYKEINGIIEEEKIKNKKILKELLVSPKVFDVEKLTYSQAINKSRLLSYINILKDKNKILYKYYFYTLIYNFSKGSYKTKIKQKRADLKQIIRKYSLR